MLYNNDDLILYKKKTNLENEKQVLIILQLKLNNIKFRKTLKLIFTSI